MLKDKVDGMGRRVTIGRAAVLTQRHNGRAACHYCGPCHRGCSTASYFSSPTSTLPAAAATGKLTLITHALVHRVTLDAEARADGVLYFDTKTGQEQRVRAPIVILAASTLASARLLLTSAEDRFPQGLANSSGLVGHYLMDHIFAVGADGYLPLRKGAKAELAKRPNGIYIPRFRNVRDKQQGFVRGYGYQGGESVTVFEQAYTMPGFGAEWKERVKSETVARLSLTGFGEMLARQENRCYLDPDKKDAWGVPVLRIDVAARRQRGGDGARHDRAGGGHAGGGRRRADHHPHRAAAAGLRHPRGRHRAHGQRSQDLGARRRSCRPTTSRTCSSWTARATCRSAASIPTLTMMALTVRACENLVAEAKRGNLA